MHEPGLTALCAALRAVTGAVAVSVARIDDDGLRYVAADGTGAAEIVGTVLTGGRGLASFAAATGQSLAIEHVAADPRFARDVAERTGYVPTAMLVVPILDTGGEVAGVLSVLDRAATLGDDDALAVAGRLADVATHLLSVSGDRDRDLRDRISRLDEPGRRAVLAVLEALGA